MLGYSKIYPQKVGVNWKRFKIDEHCKYVFMVFQWILYNYCPLRRWIYTIVNPIKGYSSRALVRQTPSVKYRWLWKGRFQEISSGLDGLKKHRHGKTTDETR